MRRQTCFLFFGIFAASAVAQVVACSSNNGGTTQPGEDAGADVAVPTTDSGGVFTPGCNGPLPVMTVRNPYDGGQMAPDWSCYADGAVGSFIRPFIGDDGGDAALDAADAAASDDAGPSSDAGGDSAVTDSGTTPDASAGSYRLHITDFSSGQAPVGATVDIYWGTATLGNVAFTGTVDDAGIVDYPTPPAQTTSLSYFLHPSSTELPFYFLSAPIIPPGLNTALLGDGQIEGYSTSAATYANLVSAVFGEGETPSTALAVVTGAAIDCQGNDVQGAQFALIDDATGNAVATGTGSSDPRATYIVNNLPNESCTYTNNIARGIWALANAPVNQPGSTHSYSLQMSGRFTDSQTEPVVVDKFPIELYPGSITNGRAYLLSPVSTDAVVDGG